MERMLMMRKYIPKSGPSKTSFRREACREVMKKKIKVPLKKAVHERPLMKLK